MKDVENKKNILNSEMSQLLNNINLVQYNKVLESGSSFFTEFEEYLKKQTHTWLSKADKEDILNSIENIFDFSITYVSMLNSVSKNLKTEFTLPNNFLATSQSVYKKHRKYEKFEALFNENGIPISGFKQKKAISLQTEKHDFISIIIGFILVATSIILSYVIVESTGTQYFINRALLSVGLALILSGIGKGYINVKWKGKRAIITAVGSFGVFVLLYLINPPSPPEYKTKSELEQIKNELNK